MDASVYPYPYDAMQVPSMSSMQGVVELLAA